ncbi:MAG: FtsQ-type POTRA domain-containing protein [Defluviitaleaceae bacterium]|nr:FtsQ-type POTRA domain-containing protein [Defluviitaleaceae bacterium]
MTTDNTPPDTTPDVTPDVTADETPATDGKKQKKPKKPRKPFDINRTRFFLAGIVAAPTLLALIILFSPYFHINHVAVDGIYRVSREEILTRLDITDNTHILLFNARSAQSSILQNQYIGYVRIERVLPGRINVTISERRLTAYFEHMPGSFLFLDDYGRVLEINTYFFEPLPVLVGLDFTRFQLGEILEVPDAAAFGVVVQYAQLLNQYNITHRVSHINVADSANIRILIDNIEFNVGGVTHADEKVRTIIQILETHPGVGLVPGFVDLREIRRDYIFQILY